MLFGKDPADVRPPESRFVRRVRVAGSVGIKVVDAMVASPPQGALLQGRAGEPGQNELEDLELFNDQEFQIPQSIHKITTNVAATSSDPSPPSQVLSNASTSASAPANAATP